MSHSTVDDSAAVTLTDQKVLIYNTDTQETQVYDGNNVLLKGDTVFITTQSAEKAAYKTLSQKKVDSNECFIAVKAMPNCDKIDGGKKRRKTIKASELGPEFMALMTMNAEIDNRLLQHATRTFKKKHAIDSDTYIDYDYLDVIGSAINDIAGGDSAVEGGAAKKRKTSKRRKTKKATKKAFGMDVDEYEQMQEDVILDKDIDALGDIEIDRLTVKDLSGDDLQGSGNIFDKLGAQFVTQKAIIQGGGDKIIAQCECDANQQYQELVERGAMHHATVDVVEGGKVDKVECEEQQKSEPNADDEQQQEQEVDSDENKGGAKRRKVANKRNTKAKRAEDYLSESSSVSSSISDVEDSSNSTETMSEISTDNDIDTTVMYF